MFLLSVVGIYNPFFRSSDCILITFRDDIVDYSLSHAVKREKAQSYNISFSRENAWICAYECA